MASSPGLVGWCCCMSVGVWCRTLLRRRKMAGPATKPRPVHAWWFMVARERWGSQPTDSHLTSLPAESTVRELLPATSYRLTTPYLDAAKELRRGRGRSRLNTPTTYQLPYHPPTSYRPPPPTWMRPRNLGRYSTGQRSATADWATGTNPPIMPPNTRPTPTYT